MVNINVDAALMNKRIHRGIIQRDRIKHWIYCILHTLASQRHRVERGALKRMRHKLYQRLV